MEEKFVNWTVMTDVKPKYRQTAYKIIAYNL